MKVYISSDMEGSTGVVSPGQTDFGGPGYEFGRRMQLHDAIAAAEAAVGWGADPVVINDSHDRMINLDAGELPSGVRLISGSPKVMGMLEGALGCDVALFIGYHAMAGTEKAVLDHTYSSRVVYDLSVDGRKMGETGLNALFCGAMGVPVGLVAGDQAVCLESGSLLGPELETCELKEGLGRCAAKLLPPSVTAEMLALAVKKALDKAAAGRCPILTPEPPHHMELTFFTTAQTDAAGLTPHSERISGRTLAFDTEDVYELRRWLCSCIDSALTAEL